MLNKGQNSWKSRPDYLADEYLPGLHHQSWAPVDDWYHWRPTSTPRRNWIGYLMESYSGVVIGFWVVPSLELDGFLPTDPQYVINTYKWDFGVIGATVRVEEDRYNQRWLALQQEYICPDDRVVSPPTPPPSGGSTGNPWDEDPIP